MKKLILLLFITLPLYANAQNEDTQEVAPKACTCRFGVIDYNAILESLPEWKEAQQQVAALKAKYDAESERAEGEFQSKFTEFLEGQKDFPQNIMEKRQKELQTLLEQSVQFRQSAQKLLKEAEADYTMPARQKLNDALKQVAAEQGLVFIFNSSQDQIPFVDQSQVIDVAPLLAPLFAQP